MLKLEVADLQLFKDVLGQSLLSCFSYRIEGNNNSVSYWDGAVGMHFSGRAKIYFYTTPGFVEDEMGIVFHDYKILTEANPQMTEELICNTTPISEILIYGRPFNPETFKAWPNIYEAFKHETHTDDVFLFKFEDGNQMLVFFDLIGPCMGININERIRDFWESVEAHDLSYSLHHHLKA